ncbi:hypothetical protein AB6A40_011462 [Gnathostoma spinigerum]|uniref:Uncharacterized protein n=1 Tax=Gnathostoma spinigerum TaxID=75299 RepID=A0ABD6EYC4_9BILA
MIYVIVSTKEHSGEGVKYVFDTPDPKTKQLITSVIDDTALGIFDNVIISRSSPSTLLTKLARVGFHVVGFSKESENYAWTLLKE